MNPHIVILWRGRSASPRSVYLASVFSGSSFCLTTMKAQEVFSGNAGGWQVLPSVGLTVKYPKGVLLPGAESAVGAC